MVTLPKGDPDRDNGLTDDVDIPESQSVFVERADEGVYVVRLCDDGEVPELETTNLVERLAAKHAQEMMSQRNQGPLKTAD